MTFALLKEVVNGASCASMRRAEKNADVERASRYLTRDTRISCVYARYAGGLKLAARCLACSSKQQTSRLEPSPCSQVRRGFLFAFSLSANILNATVVLQMLASDCLLTATYFQADGCMQRGLTARRLASRGCRWHSMLAVLAALATGMSLDRQGLTLHNAGRCQAHLQSLFC